MVWLHSIAIAHFQFEKVLNNHDDVSWLFISDLEVEPLEVRHCVGVGF
jgi:hypothetical protein